VSHIKRLHSPHPPPVPGVAGSAGVLYFAGEATDELDLQQVHGAMASGQRAADSIMARLGMRSD